MHCHCGTNNRAPRWTFMDPCNMRRHFYLDVYIILNRIQFTIWIICAFRVLNPRQWSLAKQSNSKSWKVIPKSVKSSLSQIGWCDRPTKLQFQSILTLKILMLSNATNQPKSTVELGYMCPQGLLGPPAVTLTKKLKYETRLLLRCIHHFKSNSIYNMDHIRILGTEPSSVILSQIRSETRCPGGDSVS